jgi:hypothetical protein
MRRYLEQHPHAFDPETVRILGAALDDAWERLKAKEATVAGYDAHRRYGSTGRARSSTSCRWSTPSADAVIVTKM